MLRLNADRTIDVLYDDGNEVKLRPPTIAEWRKVREAYMAGERAWKDEVRAYQQMLEEVAEGDEVPPPPVMQEFQYGDANPFGQAFALVVDTLSNTTPSADDLPVWAADPRLYKDLHDHWRVVKIERAHVPTPAPEPAGDVPFDPVAAGLQPEPVTPTQQPAPASPAPLGMQQRPLPRAVQGALSQSDG